MLENLFGTPKEKGTQLYFRDDARATFRKLPIEDASMVQKDKDGNMVAGWVYHYKKLFDFLGYKSIPAGKLTLAFNRSPDLEYCDMLEKDEKFPKDGKLDSPYVSRIAADRCYKIDSSTKGNSSVNKVIMFFGSGILLELIIIGVLKVLERYR